MRTFKLAATGAAILSAFLFMSTASAAMKDGTYEAKVIGHNAPMTVKVTVSDGKVKAIETKDLETIGVGKVALKKLSQEIIEKQSIGIDALTGATISSAALQQGVKACLEEAGADMKAWTKRAEAYPTAPLEVKGDVVVIGGGGSGLAAAVSALQNGAEHVVVIEKLGFLGGSTTVSGGAFNAADPKRQKPMGIEDSVEKHYEQTMKGGHDVGTPELVRYLTSNAYPTIEWLESLGMTFKDKIGTATGALWQRSHYPTKPAGTGYVEVLSDYLAKAGGKVEVLLETSAEHLIVKDGKVTGVKANRHGQPITVDAESVVIATGGFGANIKLRQEVNTGVWKEVKLDSSIGCTNLAKAAQGDGLKLGQEAGADLIGLSDIQLHPNGTPGTGLMQDIATSGRNRIFVNLEGNRFVSESAARDTLCKAIFQQPEGTYWLVMNKLRYPDPAKPDKMGVTMNDMLSLGRVKTAATLEELAKIIGVNAENLKASVAEYNKAASHEVKKDKFGFEANNTEDKPMTEGPWYACRKVPTVHHTMGGLHINTKAEVIGTNGKPIENLYAAGEVTGGIHGANRLGGNA